MELRGKTIAVLGGKTGLLGQALVKALTAAKAKPKPLSSKDCDIVDPGSVERVLNKIDPDVLINAAAYTQVDLAEEQEEVAFALNATAPPLLAAAAARRGIPFLHYSTDFVFSGNRTTPYTVYDNPGAFSVYGISKAEGEKNLIALGYDGTLIIRTSWLFGPDKMNFVKKIITLATERNTLKVVDDQTGSPSYTPDVAANSIKLLEKDATGIFHLANSGTATWFDLASEAVRLAGLPCTVEPIPTSGYPTPAVRPAYSVLDLTRFIQTTGETPRHWKDALKEYINQEKDS
ncbi:dTDP-4-dehydrorhamnose reductase [Pseudodesulfovibrio cashew]|uniref:dTDP-4-dehydrorhamnose reductase n=1 Tax=Pseudodesulfovibrio cashew TaxID=2678688 RepID=A0A6I6JL09_9BACT|nr:dTDP-4-dehydrorhamnose reductase [Pseudodesulfovibrio cashew]QGY40963.1 dTDP-4-dehydrorhamnose reductase [Pseudodesulfovibrio cashew]